MPAHSTSPASGSAWIHKGCSTCATGKSPSATGPSPRVTDTKYAPRVGQIWCIEESIFSPVAGLLEQTMPVIMAASVASFSDDRASKSRPCLIYQAASSSDDSHLVYLFGTFNGGKIKYLPQALQFFLAQVDPQASTYRPKDFKGKRLPCMHSSPSWAHHPQFVVALPHWTKPGFGKRRKLNHLDRVWTDCKDCTHEKTSRAKNDNCPTFQFCESQQKALNELSVRKYLQWQKKSDEEMGRMTMEFRTALDAKIEARARDNESILSLDTVVTDIASGRTDMTSYTKPPMSNLRHCISVAVDGEAQAKEGTVPALTREASVSESSSGESDSEVETPAMEHAELPQPLIQGVERLTLDFPPNTLVANEPRPELSPLPTPKQRMFNRPAKVRTTSVPRSPTGSVRSGARSLLKRVVHSATNDRPSERQYDHDFPALPTSPTTPTSGRWRSHRRRDSQASKASTARGA